MIKPENNLYMSLQQLAWSTFLGVISFQVIVPNVWLYIHSVTGMSYFVAYRAFVVFYAILLPLQVLLWLRYHYSDLKACLFPFDKEDSVNDLCRFFLLGIILNLTIQAVLIALFLSGGSSRYVFGVLQILAASISVILFCIGAYVSHQRVSVFLFPSPEQQIGNNYPAKENKRIKTRFTRILYGWMTFTCLIVAFEISYWHKNSSYFSEDQEEAKLGFGLLTQSDKTDTLLRLVKQRQENLTAIKNKNAFDTLQKSAVIDSKINSGTKELAYDDDFSKLSIDNQNLGDARVLSSIYDNATIKVGIIHKIAQKKLGVQLRDSQLKILFSLLNVFLCVISIFIFLQVDKIIKAVELKAIEEKKRLGDPGDKTIESELIEKEKQSETSNKMLDGAWLYITIGIWLIIPLLKPVKDESIDTKAPFKMLTFSRPDTPLREGDKFEDNHISGSFNTNIDSLIVQFNKQYPQDSIELSKIRQRLRAIENHMMDLKDSVKSMSDVITIVKKNSDFLKPRNNKNK